MFMTCEKSYKTSHGNTVPAVIKQSSINIGIKHGFSYINICQVPREMLKTEAAGRGFQHLLSDLANIMYYNVRLANDHLYGRQLFTWLSLVMSLMVFFAVLFFPRDALPWIRSRT